MSKASGKVKKKKIYFCTNVILSLMYTWMMGGVGPVLFLLLDTEARASPAKPGARRTGFVRTAARRRPPRAGVGPRRSRVFFPFREIFKAWRCPVPVASRPS